ncbi:MAG: glucose-1-phosphate thymidylyltransferase, partial [bacterium]|nr:glucose-1-phosphate thymidylyltransferase [bacterium]
EYVTQPEPRGIAHALGITRTLVGDDDILLYLGDNMLKCGVADVVASFEETRPNCGILLSRVVNPERFGVVVLDSAGRVIELVEKPERPESDYALAGVYLFDRSIWAALDALEPSERGEYEITEAIQHLLDGGSTVAASEVDGWWKDTGRKEDLLEANDLVLATVETEIAGTVVGSDADGQLVVGTGSSLTNCRVRGPVIVGDDTTVTDSTLGPGTSIGNGCVLNGATVARSVILDGAHVERWKLESSLLGRDVAMRGVGPDAAVSVTLGERSEVVG